MNVLAANESRSSGESSPGRFRLVLQSQENRNHHESHVDCWRRWSGESHPSGTAHFGGFSHLGSRQAKPDAPLWRLAQDLYWWRGRQRIGKLLRRPCGPGTLRPANAAVSSCSRPPRELTGPCLGLIAALLLLAIPALGQTRLSEHDQGFVPYSEEPIRYLADRVREILLATKPWFAERWKTTEPSTAGSCTTGPEPDAPAPRPSH